jgi:hypothetical protein
MKLKKFVPLAALVAALAVFYTASCSSPLEVTSPSGDLPKQAASFESGTQAAKNINGYYPDESTGITPSTLSVTGSVNGNVTVTFPAAVGLDILNYDTAEAFERELKKVLFFYSLTEIASDSRKASPQSDIVYNVVERTSYDTVQLQLKIDNKTSSKIEACITGSAYTYRNGNTIDLDGNGIPGEAGYDDWYQELGVIGGQKPGDAKEYISHNPQKGFDLAFEWEIEGGSLRGSGSENNKIFPLELSSPKAKYLKITYNEGVNDTFNYKDAINKLVRIQKYDQVRKEYVDITSGRGEISRTVTTSAHFYRILLTGLAHKDNLRVLVNNEEGLTTNEEYYGVKQRFYADTDSHAERKKKVVEKLKGYAEDEGFQNIESESFFNATSKMFTNGEGRNAVVVLDFSLAETDDQGLDPQSLSPQTTLNSAIKVGYKKKDEEEVYIPISSAELSGTGTPQLRLYLDPSFNANSLLGQEVTIYVREELKSLGDASGGVKAKVFGDYKSLTLRGGLNGYRKAGTISSANITNNGDVFNNSTPPNNLSRVWGAKDGERIYFGENKFYSSLSQCGNGSVVKSILENVLNSGTKNLSNLGIGINGIPTNIQKEPNEGYTCTVGSTYYVFQRQPSGIYYVYSTSTSPTPVKYYHRGRGTAEVTTLTYTLYSFTSEGYLNYKGTIYSPAN